MEKMMERWSFNTLLFSRLTDVLDISITEIAKRCGIRQQVLSRYMSGENVLPVKILIQMCNALRMPCHFFVSEYNNYEIPNREIATIAAGQWQPVEWNRQAVEHTFGDGEGRIYWKDVAVVMGITAQKPHDRFLLRKRFPITDFMDVCNHFCLSPFDFLVDMNRGGIKKGVRKPTANGDAAASPLLADIATLRQQMADLTDKYHDVIRKYDDTLTKYADLLEAHKSLLRRFEEHISANVVSMAADNGPET